MIITSDAEGGSYELITFSTNSTSASEAQDVKRSELKSFFFVFIFFLFVISSFSLRF